MSIASPAIMPNTGGIESSCLPATVIAIVAPNRPQIAQPPYRTSASSRPTFGRAFSIAKFITIAGTSQLTTDGTNSLKNLRPLCQRP